MHFSAEFSGVFLILMRYSSVYSGIFITTWLIGGSFGFPSERGVGSVVFSESSKANGKATGRMHEGRFLR